MYGLKQAHKAWYERLINFLIENDFERGKIDTTLLIEKENDNLLIIQIYVDDIIFGGISIGMCGEFTVKMYGEFEMTMMGELNYFLGL